MEFIFYIILIGVLTIFGCYSALEGRYIAATVACVSTIVFSRIHMVTGASHLKWHDSYYYFSVATAIQERGYTDIPAGYYDWYPTASLADQPIYQILTVIVSDITGIDLQMLKPLMPALMAVVLFFILLFAFSVAIDKQFGIIAAIIVVMLDPFFVYLSQYHSQGAGIVYFALVIAVITCINRFERYHVVLLLIPSMFALTFTHRFTSLLSVLVFGSIVTILLVVQSLETYTDASLLSRHISPSFLLVITVFLLTHHVFISSGFITSAMARVLLGTTISPAISAGGSASGGTIIDRFSLFLKIVIVVLALPSMYQTVKQKTKMQFWLVLLGIVGIVGIPLALTSGSTTDRIVLFGYLLLIPFAVNTLRQLSSIKLREPYGSTIAIGVAVGIVLMGVLAGTVPSLVDHDADINEDGYHEIRPLSEQEAVSSGTFIETYHEDPIYVTFWTRMIANYYAGIPIEEVDNPEISRESRGVYDAERHAPPSSDNVVYSNGRIYIRGCHPRSPECDKWMGSVTNS